MVRFLRLLTAAALLLSVKPGLASSGVSRDDLMPWPWGSECPFPWSNIEGVWVSIGNENPTRFTFEVKGLWDSSTRLLEIRRYNSDDELVGIGEGTSQRREKIVRAAMIGIGLSEGESYWAIIRTYNEEQSRSCARSKQITVVTLRDADGSNSHDVHMVIEKEQSARP